MFFLVCPTEWAAADWITLSCLKTPLLSALFRNILKTWSVFFYAALGASSLILGGSLHPTASHELQLKGRGVFM